MSTSVAKQHLKLLLARSGVQASAEKKEPESLKKTTNKDDQSSKGKSQVTSKRKQATSSSKDNNVKKHREANLTNSFIDAVDAKNGSRHEIARQMKRAAKVLAVGTGNLAHTTAAVSNSEAKAERQARSQFNRNLDILTRTSKKLEAKKASAAKVRNCMSYSYNT